MRQLKSPFGIDQGSKMLFADFATGGPMWTGTGEREVRIPITFSQTFHEQPAVMVGLSMWDMANDTNLRVDLSAEAITRKGFQLVFKTWGDSRIARARAEWTAIGTLRDDDDWDVE